MIQGVLAAAERHALPVERLSRTAALERFPGLAVPADSVVVFERSAGYLLVERVRPGFH